MNVINRVEAMERELNSLIMKAELWQLIFDESPTAIACFDNDMNFVMVNNSFCKLTGFSKNELLTEKLKYVIPFNDRKNHQEYELQYLQSTMKNNNHPNGFILNANREKIEISIELTSIKYNESLLSYNIY